MKYSNPSNVFDSSKLIDELLDSGITYSSITLLDKAGDAYFSNCSSEEWLHTYIDSGLYVKCHLMQEANKQLNQHNNGFIFIWDNYFPVNEESVYLERLRREKDISHGVAFCSPLKNGGKAILTVAGKYYDVNFSRNIIKNKHAVYQAIMKSFVAR